MIFHIKSGNPFQFYIFSTMMHILEVLLKSVKALALDIIFQNVFVDILFIETE